ncbi:hypothetical protein, partial [Paenibacillus sp. BJ-4]|uniref:hypothetical protein n=1 Tax=Paenibacillus sp. BJ-4 TaxID=2878097 RepID=UPI001CF0D2E5
GETGVTPRFSQIPDHYYVKKKNPRLKKTGFLDNLSPDTIRTFLYLGETCCHCTRFFVLYVEAKIDIAVNISLIIYPYYSLHFSSLHQLDEYKSLLFESMNFSR